MNLQSFFKSLENINYRLLEQTESYVIVDISESNWYGGRYIAYSTKWEIDNYFNSLEEAKQWIEFVNSKEPISPQVIYNSKVLYKTTDIPNWLEEKVGLYCDLEDINQDSIVIKTHIRDTYKCIDVSSVWFKNKPIMVVVQGLTKKNGTDNKILITDFEGYRLMVSYLYQFKIEKVANEEQYTKPKNISLVWGYFTEDLLKEITCDYSYPIYILH